MNKTLVKHVALGVRQTCPGLVPLVLEQGAGGCFSHTRAHRLQEWFLRARASRQGLSDISRKGSQSVTATAAGC